MKQEYNCLIRSGVWLLLRRLGPVVFVLLCGPTPRLYGQCLPAAITSFEGFSPGTAVLFQPPRFSQSTVTHLAASPDVSEVTTAVSTAHGVAAAQLSWAFIDGGTNRWVRVTTFNANGVPNPTVELNRPLRIRFRLDGPAGSALRVCVGLRETGTSAAVGADGGTSGAIEWIGATGPAAGTPGGKLLHPLPGVWQTFIFNPAGDGVTGFTGNSTLSSATGKGTFEHLAFTSTGHPGPFTVYVDDIRLLCAPPPPVPGDLDLDGDVDLADYAFFQACVTGPVKGQLLAACATADFDADQDVDQSDFGILQGCLSGPNVPGDPECAGSLVTIPPRPANAISGSQFVQQVTGLSASARDAQVLAQITSGNLPEFLRNFHPISLSGTGAGGGNHSATFYVMPDYLAVGSDADFVRMPMMPSTAQAIADQFRCILPTRKMVNHIWSAATVKLAPYPFSPSQYDITSLDIFVQHHQAIEGQRAGNPLGALVGGIKKDVVISNRLVTFPDRVAIYGWHQLNGSPIQPLSTVHVASYLDYSHGIRLVRDTMIVDGQQRQVADVLRDPELYPLLSDEDVFTKVKY